MSSIKLKTRKKIPLTNDMDFINIVLAKQNENPHDDEKIKFYCKDCEEIVEVEKSGEKLKFQCKKCKGKNISYGTNTALENFYHLN